MTTTLTPRSAILLVDDEVEAIQSTERILRATGYYNLLTQSDSRQVMQTLEEHRVGVVLLDLSMPYLSGEKLLPRIVETHPDITVVVVTGVDDVETAVRSIKHGAYDYIVKPVEHNHLISAVRRAVELRELRSENSRLRHSLLAESLSQAEAFSCIVTRHPTMQAIFRYVESIAPTARPVLVTGETGVGKELVARALHDVSGRPGPFVALNAAGLDDNVFSDSLFGHAKGAFTSADSTRKGFIEQARDGTLFLDEIGDLGAPSQVKLLRLLQENEYFPLGSDIPKRSNARIVVATNRDLADLQEQGRFRRDLFYRLQTHRIHIPPLRERRDDIPLLLEHFLHQSARTLGKQAPTVPPELGILLSNYDFPGNIRELEAMVFDVVSKHKSRMLSMDAFRDQMQHTDSVKAGSGEMPRRGYSQQPFAGMSPLPDLREGARLLVIEAMERAQGNQSIAAKLLGISRTALNKRLRQYKEEGRPVLPVH